MLFSKETGGFYDASIHGESVPDDVVEITSEQHKELIAGQSQGKRIQSDNSGYPILVEPPPPTIEFFRKAKHADINQWRDQQEAENLLFAHAGHQWDGGKVSRERMDEMRPLADIGGLPEGFYWTTADNVNVPMDAVALKNLDEAMTIARGLRGFEIHARQRAMKAEVEALANVGETPTQEQLSAAIAAIQAYAVGWPEVTNAG